MITAKRLVLLLLTGIVIASVACGPSAEELKQVARCEDALERRASTEKLLGEYKIQQSSFDYAKYLSAEGGNPLAQAIAQAQSKLSSVNKDIDKYCK